MLFRHLKNTIIVVIFLFAGFSVVGAQQTPEQPLKYRAVFWADEKLATEVYLTEKRGSGDNNFRLTVISDKNLKVIYHTRINSIEAVDVELTPVKSVAGVKYYEFRHYFSKMTIWMSVEFTLDGKRMGSLTRTFYDNLFETVPNDQFLDKPVKKTDKLSFIDSQNALL